MRAKLRTRKPIQIPHSTHKAYEVKEEGDQSWAVSYADLLMVLLSFFILFFSLDDTKKNSLIQTLTLSIQSDSKAGQNGAQEQRVPQFVDPNALAEVSKELNIKTTATENQLIIDLPDDIFQPGRTVPEKQGQTIIETVFKKLMPYENKITLTIVGHTDQSPLVKSTNRWIQDNIDLSARRATSAYKIAKFLGFNENHLDIKASGPQMRNTRSLSIIVQEKKAGTL